MADEVSGPEAFEDPSALGYILEVFVEGFGVFIDLHI